MKNAELKKQSQWVSVDDELPALEERVLLKTQSNEVVTGWLRKLTEDDIYFCFGNEFSVWDFDFNYDLGAATHWMPLPEPPE